MASVEGGHSDVLWLHRRPVSDTREGRTTFAELHLYSSSVVDALWNRGKALALEESDDRVPGRFKQLASSDGGQRE